MAMVCKNIGKTGRRVRIIGGIIILAGGAVGVLMAWGVDRKLAVGIGGGALLLGGFMIFEGMMGWCALRALGMKTKL